MNFSALVFFDTLGSAYPVINALNYVAAYVARLPKGEQREIGYAHANSQLRLTTHSTTPLLSATHFIVDAILQLTSVQVVRAARGVRMFKPMRNITHSLLMWWQDDVESYHLHELKSAGPMKTPDVVGDTWSDSKYIQFLCTTLGTDLSRAVADVQERSRCCERHHLSS